MFRHFLKKNYAGMPLFIFYFFEEIVNKMLYGTHENFHLIVDNESAKKMVTMKASYADNL